MTWLLSFLNFKNIKTVLVFVVIGIVLFSFWFNYYQYNQNKKLKTERAQLVKVANENERVAQRYINLHGLEVSKNDVLLLSLKNAKDIKHSNELSFVKEFAGVKQNLMNLEATIRLQAALNLEAREKNRDTVLVVHNHFANDTIKAKAFSYKDSLNHFWGYMFNDSTVINANVNVPIKGAVYWQREKKFWFIRYGKKIYRSEFFTDNKKVRITNQQVVKIIKE